MPVLLTPPFLQFFNTNGAVLVNGTVTTLAAGTVSTNKATYTDSTGSQQAPNPVQLNSSGVPETGNGSIWIQGSYRIIIKDQFGVVVSDTDNVTSFTPTITGASNSYFQSFSGNGSLTSFTLSQNLGSDENAVMVFVNNTPSIPNIPFFQALTSIAAQVAFPLSQNVGTDPKAIEVYKNTTSLGFQRLQPTTDYTVSGVSPTVTTVTTAVAPGAFTPGLLVFQNPAFGDTSTGIGFQILNPSQYTLSGTSLVLATAPKTGVNNIQVWAPSTLLGAAAISAAAADASATTAGNAAATANADVVLTHADVVLTHADVALTHADVVLTHADVVSTHNDVITTGNNVTASGVNATNAANSAIASNASAVAAQGALTGTSTTSVTIANSVTKNFTAQPGLNFGAGGFYNVASNANSANYMHGQCASYNITTGAFSLNVLDIGGSGTFADWNISVSGPRGNAGTGTGDASTNTATSVIGELGVFADTTGKLFKRSTGSGLMQLTSGVAAPISNTGVPVLTSGSVTSALTVGVAANNLVQLNGSSQLPAVDGSLLTGITAGAPLNGTNTWTGLNTFSAGLHSNNISNSGTIGSSGLQLTSEFDKFGSIGFGYNEWPEGQTTNATPLLIVPGILSGVLGTSMLDALVTARRTGGSAGTAGDSAAFRVTALYKNNTVIVGSVTVVTIGNSAAYAATIATSGGNIGVQVTGVANTNINWRVEANIQQV